ncbi:MAG: T9SS type A sorting domain-containing protein [Flavobacteriales bacterium]|nr:T9SS type A sorting domain-containing protein [Flavobacteriales bacterium]
MGRALLFVLLLVPIGAIAQVPDLSGYEYWYDQADADNERVFVPFTSPGQTVSLSSEQLAAAGLGVGQHRLHIRLRDQAGRWSSTLFRSFLIHPSGPFQVISGEYWFDQDDVNRQPFALTPGGSVSITLNTPAAGLTVGQHRVHYRLRDDQGAWSSVLARKFLLTAEGPHELVLLRYWSEPVPQSPGDLTEVPITPAVQVLDIIDDVLFCNWSSTGQTDVYFQLQDNLGQWSSVITRGIDVDAVSAPPAATAVSGPAVVLDNSAQTYTAATVPGASYYVWTLPTGWSGTSTGNSINVTTGAPGEDGWVVVTAGNGCGLGDPDSLFVTITGTGMATEGTTGILLFPNPTTGLVTIALPDVAGVEGLMVVSSTGQRIYETGKITTDRHTLDLSAEAGGLYTVILTRGTQHTKLHVMVQR